MTLMYPAPHKAKEFGCEPFDVLEDKEDDSLPYLSINGKMTPNVRSAYFLSAFVLGLMPNSNRWPADSFDQQNPVKGMFPFPVKPYHCAVEDIL